jgi:spermidine synthase
MIAILATLFLLSGISALIYQVLWMRMLSLVFGVTVYAASTVLACFMGGLALGSFGAGRIADRVRRPLAWFGVAELLIAATALASPLLLEAVATVYVPLAADASTLTKNVARIVGCALVLLPATVLMGATLPLVLRSSLVDTAGIGARVSLLYGVNTAGAIAGALLAGYVLIGSVGVSTSFRIAASLNVIVGVTALLYSRRLLPSLPPARTPGDVPQPTPAIATRGRHIIPFVFAISGLTSIALEVIWFRSLVLYYAATTYAFTTMLATVLAGIAIGSLAVSPLLKRREPTLVLFGALHAAIGVVALAGAAGLAALYDPATPSLVGGAMALQLPAALLMGAAFPVGCRLWLRSAGEAGRGLGILYSVNLLGSILGSLGAGFFLLPRFGSATSLAIVAGLGTATGVAVLLVAARTRRVIPLALIVIALATFAMAHHELPDPFTTGLARRHRDAGRIFMKDEGVQTTVSVHVRELGGRQLYLDGLHQASDGRGVVLLHRQIGHVPVLLHPNPKRALVIGLGGGATAGAVSLHPLDVEIVELAPGVVKAADWFTHVNEDVLRRPNVTVRVDDARNTLLLRRGRYDVITADIIQPTHAGAGLLYSQEYFELARRALNTDGVMVQWVGPRSELYYKLIARTFQRVFPETTVWVDGTLLVGSIKPLKLEAGALAGRFVDPALQRALAAAGIPNAEALLAHYTAGPDALRAYVGDGPVLTDDRPLLEYYRSLPHQEKPIDLRTLKGQ